MDCSAKFTGRRVAARRMRHELPEAALEPQGRGGSDGRCEDKIFPRIARVFSRLR